MRTEKNWPAVKEKIKWPFTPRLEKDLAEIPYELAKIPAFGSYYIYGKVGSGKTLLAAHMYTQAMKKQYLEAIKGRFLFINVYDFFNELKKTFGKDDMDEEMVMSTYRSAVYLVLDDLGSTKLTDWNISALQELINYRYEHMLTTVITSNLSLDELTNAMGDERISSRIRRMCEILKKV